LVTCGSDQKSCRASPVFFTSLTPPLSLSPLWISWAENEGAEGRVGVLYLRREPAAPLPGGRLPPRTSA